MVIISQTKKILKTAYTNREKMNLKKIANMNNQKDYRLYTEINDSLVSNNNKNTKNKINNIPISDSKMNI